MFSPAPLSHICWPLPLNVAHARIAFLMREVLGSFEGLGVKLWNYCVIRFASKALSTLLARILVHCIVFDSHVQAPQGGIIIIFFDEYFRE